MKGEFCRTMMEFDLVPMWITPFIRVSDNVARRSKLVAAIEQFRPLPFIAQIMGNNRSCLAGTAERLASIPDCLGIELNCSCPSPTVVRRQAGGALLRTPSWICDTVRHMQDRAGPAVGVKLRSGFDTADELENVLAIVCDADPAWITFHHRTVQESYTAVPEARQRFRRARACLGKRIMLASGDLFSVDDCLSLASNVNVDGLTPARGLLRNPWLIRAAEAACRGESYESPHVHSFLIRLAELTAERRRWHPGLILEIATNLWDPTDERFAKLLEASKDPARLIAVLESL